VSCLTGWQNIFRILCNAAHKTLRLSLPGENTHRLPAERTGKNSIKNIQS